MWWAAGGGLSVLSKSHWASSSETWSGGMVVVLLARMLVMCGQEEMRLAMPNSVTPELDRKSVV